MGVLEKVLRLGTKSSNLIADIPVYNRAVSSNSSIANIPVYSTQSSHLILPWDRLKFSLSQGGY